MSILGEIADEAMKPVKTAAFIGSAVVITGAAVLAANSKTGRKFFSSVKESMKSDSKKKDESKDDTKAEEIAPPEPEVNKEPEVQKIESNQSSTQGQDNA